MRVSSSSISFASLASRSASTGSISAAVLPVSGSERATAGLLVRAVRSSLTPVWAALMTWVMAARGFEASKANGSSESLKAASASTFRRLGWVMSAQSIVTLPLAKGTPASLACAVSPKAGTLPLIVTTNGLLAEVVGVVISFRVRRPSSGAELVVPLMSIESIGFAGSLRSSRVTAPDALSSASSRSSRASLAVSFASAVTLASAVISGPSPTWRKKRSPNSRSGRRSTPRPSFTVRAGSIVALVEALTSATPVRESWSPKSSVPAPVLAAGSMVAFRSSSNRWSTMRGLSWSSGTPSACASLGRISSMVSRSGRLVGSNTTFAMGLFGSVRPLSVKNFTSFSLAEITPARLSFTNGMSMSLPDWMPFRAVVSWARPLTKSITLRPWNCPSSARSTFGVLIPSQRSSSSRVMRPRAEVKPASELEARRSTWAPPDEQVAVTHFRGSDSSVASMRPSPLGSLIE